MDKVQARRLRVPFNVFKQGKVDVFVLPTTQVVEDVPLAALVDLDGYRHHGLAVDTLGVTERVDPTTLVDRRDVAQGFGVTCKGPLVSYRDLSRYGWGLSRSLPGRGVPPDYGSRASYWTVFFAQNVMRGFAIRLISCEMDVLTRDARGDEVYFKPWVRMFKREVKAYRNVPPVRNLSMWVDEQSVAMWRRVSASLTQEVNKTSLAYELRHGAVVALRQEKRFADTEESED